MMEKPSPSISPGGEGLNFSFYMHDEAVAASSPPDDTAGRYLPYESADSYKPTKKIGTP
jgi:hypothetical protein